MLLKYVLQPHRGIRQGDWVVVENCKGIYIVSLSKRVSIVATYINNKREYVRVVSKGMIKVDRVVDSKLFGYAKRHILWNRRVNDGKRKEDSRKEGERKSRRPGDIHLRKRKGTDSKEKGQPQKA